MADAFLGEVRLFSFSKIPAGWLPCDGRLLPILSNQALYSLLGTAFGGDGTTTFGVPDLRGRVPVGYDYRKPGYLRGAKGGDASITLTSEQTPPHTHNMQVTTGAGTTSNVAGGYYAAVANSAMIYGPPSSPMVAMDPVMLVATGGGAPHSNMQPYVAVSYCICSTGGYYPPRP